MIDNIKIDDICNNYLYHSKQYLANMMMMKMPYWIPTDNNLCELIKLAADKLLVNEEIKDIRNTIIIKLEEQDYPYELVDCVMISAGQLNAKSITL